MKIPCLRASLGAVALALTVLSNTGHAALTEQSFVSKTTGDLVALCSASPSDNLYTAAMNFCHGFGAGT